jgi:phenylacetic acid degradation operon negative regulatory protein
VEVACGQWTDQGRFEHTARSLLLTMFGELVVPAGEPVRTASLLYVLTGLGISEPASRQALARAAEAGWLVSQRQGRETWWRATSTLTGLVEDITVEVGAFNAATTSSGDWDRTGLIVHVSVPTRQAALRKELYSSLRHLGFGNPSAGLWLSPRTGRLPEVSALIQRLGLRERASVFIGRLASAGLTESELLERGWELDELTAHYRTLVQTYSTLNPRPGDELLFTYLRLVDCWRAFPPLDPRLPPDLPPDWPGHHAAELYVWRRARWKPAARQHWHHITLLHSAGVHP